GNLAKEGWRDVPARMEGHRCAAAIGMTELLVRAALADFYETELLEVRDDLAWLQNGD
ncbi:MAG: hypothetical protein HW376_668, partial [candidate division NC10 bacterium]|nr:hypothetical protein [candidate division NC10 bacterium]